jgi:hypothetical protein
MVSDFGESPENMLFCGDASKNVIFYKLFSWLNPVNREFLAAPFIKI